MYGVILWSNSDDRKAVIWCEDQGHLAYYEDELPTDGGTGAFFDAGDYVEFDVFIDDTLHRAHNTTNVMPTDKAVELGRPYDFVSAAFQPGRTAEKSSATATVYQIADHRSPAAQTVHDAISRLG